MAITIRLQSFGRKYGVPEAELVLDVRCLDNPFWVPELKSMSGLDAPVRDYVFRTEESRRFAALLLELLKLQAELSEKHGRRELFVAVGCTGGRHRSVAVAEYLAEELAADGAVVTVTHRDIEKG